MLTWDPETYLQFAGDRSRPFVDLVARIDADPTSVVDLGCGPGHLTQVLRARWPEASVLGVDSSPEMIDRATAGNSDPLATYELADVSTWVPTDETDVLVSNALFQWVPDQLAVVERLAGSVARGGTFALQVPRNHHSPSHQLLHEMAGQAPYAEHIGGIPTDRTTDPTKYFELFTGLGWQVDLWETTYFHVLEGDDPVFDWVSGTGARPFLQGLPEGLRGQFVETYRSRLREAFPRQAWGTLFPFLRTFVVARRAG